MQKKEYDLFFNEIDKMLKKVRETQKENILEAAKLISECIKNDGLVHTFGAGHSHMLAEEIFYRAATLAPVHAILEPSLTGHQEVMKSGDTEKLDGFGKIIVDHINFTSKDIFIIISNAGRNAVPIEVAMEARKKGNKVIAITSKTFSETVSSTHSSGKKLMDVADVVLDNCGKVGDFAIRIPKLEQGLGPTSTIIGVCLLNAVMVQAASNLSKIMKKPPVLWSGNLPKGREKNRKILNKYWNKIRNW